jgi:hypothetical protein
MKELLLLAVGAGLTLFGALAQAAINRRTSSSNRLLELRVEALSTIWIELVATRDIFGDKIALGHPRWLKERSKDAASALNRLRCQVDRSQVILDASVTGALREIDSYLFLFLREDEQKPSVYAREFGDLIAKLD